MAFPLDPQAPGASSPIDELESVSRAGYSLDLADDGERGEETHKLSIVARGEDPFQCLRLSFGYDHEPTDEQIEAIEGSAAQGAAEAFTEQFGCEPQQVVVFGSICS
jgi:hypothetical protein